MNEDKLKSDSALEVSEYVDQLYTEKPDRRKKKLYLEWYKEINLLAERANKLANFKIYGIIKQNNIRITSQCAKTMYICILK